MIYLTAGVVVFLFVHPFAALARPEWFWSRAAADTEVLKGDKMMFIQFFQFWFLRFAFLLAVILFAFALSRCLAWIMNGKYRSLPVLGWFVQRGTPLNHSVDMKGGRTIRKGLYGNQPALTLARIREFPGGSGQPSRNKPGWDRLGHTKRRGHCSWQWLSAYPMRYWLF